MKRLLFVTYDFPYPTNSGGKTRAYNMLKHSGSNFHKFIFSFVRSGHDKKNINELEKIGVRVAGLVERRRVSDPRNFLGLFSGSSIFKTLYYSPSIAKDLLRIITDKKIDIVHFESFYTAFFISDEIKKLGVKQIYGSENIENKIYQDYVNNNTSVLLRPLYQTQADKIKDEEISMYKKADLCLAVSSSEAKFIREYAVECEIIRNGVDIDDFKFKLPKAKAGKNILFIGNFSYFPNVDAINYFYNEVFEDLSGDFKLTVIGKKVESLGFLKDRRVEAKEFVPRIQDEYENADIFISPIRLGGGTNFKIIEAMAIGVPVISLPHRLEGLDIKDGKHLVIASTPRDFREKIELVLLDLNLRERIAKEARKLVEHEYSWKVIGNNLNSVWENL